MLNHLDLFSGIGGWTLGFHATEQIQTVGFCEIEKFPQKILKQHYPNVPIFEDIRELDYEQLKTNGLISKHRGIDILTCSYPCQPFSQAGVQRGEDDPRHLWPEVYRLIRDDRIRPMYVLGENVGGHIRIGLDSVCEDMERSGYRWRCFSIEAACIGANHRRQRVWWIAEDVGNANSSTSKRKVARKQTKAHRDAKQKRTENSTTGDVSGTSQVRLSSNGLDGGGRPNNVADTNGNGEKRNQSKYRQGSRLNKNSTDDRTTKDVADTYAKGLQGHRQSGKLEGQRIRVQNSQNEGSRIRTDNWQFEPNVGRVANGIPNRVDRLKALGNAIVPQMAYYIGQALIKDFQHKQS